MIFKETQGRKDIKDKILWAKTNGWEALKLKDLLHWFRFKFALENILYPREQGKRGGWKLFDFLFNGITNNGKGNFIYSEDEICKKHKIPQENQDEKR